VKQGKVLVVAANPNASFVAADAAILARGFDVETFTWRGKRDVLALLHRIRKFDAVYVWFASDHAAVAAAAGRLLRTPVVVVAGGADVANEQEIGYGAVHGPKKSWWLTRLALRWAHLVLTVSPLNDQETEAAGRTTNRVMLPLGIDIKRYRPASRRIHAGRPSVVAVGSVNEECWARKGQWVFAEASKIVTEADFVLIGPADARVAARAYASGGPNLVVTGMVPDDELLEHYRRASVVCQLSYHESFGMALPEATACGAIPVACGERIGSVAFLGDSVLAVPYGDVEATARAIRLGLARARVPGERRRMHELIASRLDLENRAAGLLALMGGVLGPGRR
jgi:glycosyltransferase involved in cell wall biosynthesis